MLESCPMVREFKLEVCWHIGEIMMEAYELKNLDLPNIKVLHFAGFIGCDIDVKFILDFVDYACNLETIVCDSTRYYEINDTQFVETSRSRASKFAKIIPPKISVEII